MAPDSSLPFGSNGSQDVVGRAAELGAEDIGPRDYHEDRLENGRAARNQDLTLRVQLLKSSYRRPRRVYLYSGSMLNLVHVLPRSVQYLGQF